MLTYFLQQKEFQFGDIVVRSGVSPLAIYSEFLQANLLGSTIGLYIAFHLERYYRHRREVSILQIQHPVTLLMNEPLQISRLYRPLETDYLSDSAEEEGVLLLPSHHTPTNSNLGRSKPNPKANKLNRDNLSNIWDEREELFGIGGDSDDEDARVGASNERERPLTPKTIVTQS
jgi:hypothetical protein